MSPLFTRIIYPISSVYIVAFVLNAMFNYRAIEMFKNDFFYIIYLVAVLITIFFIVKTFRNFRLLAYVACILLYGIFFYVLLRDGFLTENTMVSLPLIILGLFAIMSPLIKHLFSRLR